MTKKTKPKPGLKPVLPAQTEATAMRPADNVALINEKQLKKLLSSDAAYKEEIDELVSALRGEIKNGVDKQHLDKDVFALIKKFSKWTPEKLAYKWPIILVYMEMSGLMATIDTVLKLSLEGGSNGADEGDEEDTGKKSTPRAGFGGPASRTSETVKDLAEKSGAAPGPGAKTH